MGIKKFLNLLESRYLKIFNILLSLVSLFFVYLLLYENNIDIDLFKDPSMLLCLPVFMFSNIFMARGWSHLSDKELDKRVLYDSWFSSMLGKYIPFKIGIPLMRYGKVREQQKSYEPIQLIKNIFFEQISIIFLSLFIGSLYFIKNQTFKSIVLIALVIFLMFNLFFNKKNIILFYSNIMFGQLLVLLSMLIFTYFKYEVFYLDLVLGYIFSASLSLFFIGSPAGLGVREYISYNVITLSFSTPLTLEFIIFARILLLMSDLTTYLAYIGYKKLIRV